MILERFSVRMGSRNGRQGYDREAATNQVLFVGKSLIASKENVHFAIFRDPQQRTVLNSVPAHVVDCNDLVVTQKLPQRVIKILVEQHLHGCM